VMTSNGTTSYIPSSQTPSTSNEAIQWDARSSNRR
jgi:hypothetical protein